MRPRTELAIAVGALMLVGVVVAAVGSRGTRQGSGDPRRSTYVAGPAGARAYAEALERLGVPVTRFRRRSTELRGLDPDRMLFVVLDPSARLSALDAIRIRELGMRGAGLLLAGTGSGAAMRCYGVVAAFRGVESARIGPDTVRIGAVLVPAAEQPERRSGLFDDGSDVPCPPVEARSVDTLLATESGAPVAIRLTPDSGGAVILVSDGALFTNRSLRTSRAGELALGIVAGAFESATFDEYHHGYGSGGGMLAAVRSWSVRSPAGWALWQLGAVGLLAVLASAVRFGPARSVVERRRRSPLEHVRALANALAAARGRDVAVGLLVRGLRRRLSRAGEVPSADPRAWLTGIASQVRTARARAGVDTLRALLEGPVGPGGALRAAHAVEDVWDDLKP